MQRLRFTEFLTFCFCAWALCAPAQAQQANMPEVTIDMSVLDALAPAAGGSPATTLSRPAPRGWRPALTAPDPEPVTSLPPPPVTQTGPIVKPDPAPAAKPASKPVVTAETLAIPPVPARKPVVVAKKEAPIPSRAPVKMDEIVGVEEPITHEIGAPGTKAAKIEAPKTEASEIAIPAVVKSSGVPVEKPAVKIQKFPVQMRTVTESSNPGLDPSTELARQDHGMLPMLEDITEEAPRQQETAMAMPPLPKRRPDIQQASSSFVAAAREKVKLAARTDTKKEAVPVPPLAAIVKQDEGPSVPAMPPGAIKTEKLDAPKMPASDKLVQQILNPTKSELVEAIEKISSRTQAEKGNPKLRPPQIIASVPLTKEDIIDITASAPVQTAKANITDITATREEAKAAAIEPAAGNASSHIPRPPKTDAFEEEFVSLRFDPGVREPDEKIQSEMESGILALLRKNPAWRVQIQAFASPDGDDVSNARRISLARALAIRTWLMDKGIEASRMDVRALGAETDRNPADRVDMVFFDPKKTG